MNSSMTRRPKGKIAPFFVKKKSGQLRLVLDCRQVNQMFRKPYRPDLGPAESLQRIENPEGSPIYMGEGDLKNCFYQCGIESWLSEFFTFEEEIQVEWAKQEGFTETVDGEALIEGETYFLCLKVLPMGFSWSFYLVQEMVVHLCREGGIPSEQTLVAGWPAPDLKNGIISNPYCDNLCVFGHDPAVVNVQLDRLIVLFKKKGFELHEIEYARTVSTPLGSHFDGAKGYVGPKHVKLHKLRMAAKWFSSGRPVTGRQVEIMVGLFTHEFLFNRGAMGIFRAAYTFIQDSYDIKQPLWASAAREFAVAGRVLPLVRSSITCEWDSTVVSTDASTTGWGCTSTVRPISEIREIGVWEERWRFRRLEPCEWAPRRRAIEAQEKVDLLSDPRSLGNQLHCVYDKNNVATPYLPS